MTTNTTPAQDSQRSQSADPIRHVVLLIMENHSFDQMLGCMTDRYGDGIDGVDPEHPRSNRDDDGRVYLQQPTDELQMRFDPKHEHRNVLRQLEDDNGGFVRDFSSNHKKSLPSDRQDIMGYYRRGFLPALHTLAEEFVICDRWFSSLPGPTWPNRFFALSGTSHGVVVMPEGLKHPNLSSLVQQTQSTVFDRLNEADKSWRVYHYDLPSSWVLLRQLAPENLMRYHKIDKFFSHVKDGDLPDFTFIEPKYFGQDQNDDHPPHNVMKAEKLIADVYNAIRSNEDLWKSTLLIVFYDEHGGFYDHVPPPSTVAPDSHTGDYSFNRYGVRVPALLISPWLKAGVNHTIFDHTSLLRYLIDKWGLGDLGARAAQANSIGDALNFLPTQRSDTTAFIRVANSTLYAPRPELESYDYSNHHKALELLADHLRAKFNLPPGESSSAQTSSWLKRLPLSSSAKRWVGQKLMHWGHQLSTQNQSRAHTMARLAQSVKDAGGSS